MTTDVYKDRSCPVLKPDFSVLWIVVGLIAFRLEELKMTNFTGKKPIPTPVGNYSPDWAILFKKGSVKHIFFIAETKGSINPRNSVK